jgi:DNA phosphorothioation-dependent restriction protein DptF
MSCEFISALRRLSKLSAEAVQNIDNFDTLQDYMHIKRKLEDDFRDMIKQLSGIHHKLLILVCGSAGDGKSHLLSYLKHQGVLDSYTIINDATESDAPNRTAIETLAQRISAFRDDCLDDGNCEKVILAINLGMLNNFIDSEQGKDFSELKKYVVNNHIFDIEPWMSVTTDGIFHHIDFSNYQLYTLTSDGVKSDYLNQLFKKVFGNSDECGNNPFYQIYEEQSQCPYHKLCPVRHNFELLRDKNVREHLIQQIIEDCIKNKLVITSRDILNFIFDALVSPDFDVNKLQAPSSQSAKFLKTYISYTTPMLIFANKGTSGLIDCMTANAASDENIQIRDGKALDFYAADDIVPIALEILKNSVYEDVWEHVEPSFNDDSDKEYVYKFLSNYQKLTDYEACGTDLLYVYFIHDLYLVYSGSQKNLRKLYESVMHSIYAWNGDYGPGLMCIDDSCDDYSILEELTIRPDISSKGDQKEVVQFMPMIPVRFISEDASAHSISFSIDYSLYKMIMSMNEGYCPTAEDRNIHTDFSNRIMALAEFGKKKSKVYIVSKGKKGNVKFQFEKNIFGCSFKKGM